MVAAARTPVNGPGVTLPIRTPPVAARGGVPILPVRPSLTGDVHEIIESLIMFAHHRADPAADLALMAQDPSTRRWWELADPCRQPLDPAEAADGKWATAEEVFHVD